MACADGLRFYRGGIMYLHAIGWQLGKKDKIAIEPEKLKEKQGLYSCPPMGSQKHPFHCCLKVTEEPIKVSLSTLPVSSVNSMLVLFGLFWLCQLESASEKEV